MSTATDPQHEGDTRELAHEVEELEAQEAELERRTRSLESSGPLALIFSIVALATGIGALVVAFSRDSGRSTRTPSGTMMGASAAAPSRMMMGSGGHGRFSSSQVDAAGKGTVYVQLGDYSVAPSVASVRAGKVTFAARNVGRVPHELMIERMPMKFDSPMHPNEDAAQGIIEDMDTGRSGKMTVRLRPGSYMLFCNAPGHYVAGQHLPFTVTSS